MPFLYDLSHLRNSRVYVPEQSTMDFKIISNQTWTSKHLGNIKYYLILNSAENQNPIHPLYSSQMVLYWWFWLWNWFLVGELVDLVDLVDPTDPMDPADPKYSHLSNKRRVSFIVLLEFAFPPCTFHVIKKIALPLLAILMCILTKKIPTPSIPQVL